MSRFVTRIALAGALSNMEVHFHFACACNKCGGKHDDQNEVEDSASAIDQPVDEDLTTTNVDVSGSDNPAESADNPAGDADADSMGGLGDMDWDSLLSELGGDEEMKKMIEELKAMMQGGEGGPGLEGLFGNMGESMGQMGENGELPEMPDIGKDFNMDDFNMEAMLGDMMKNSEEGIETNKNDEESATTAPSSDEDLPKEDQDSNEKDPDSSAEEVPSGGKEVEIDAEL